VFENRVLRRVFGPKRDEVTGEWRKLHNEELNDLYSLPSIVRVVKSRRMRLAGHVARMGEDRVMHRVLVGKPEGKRPVGRLSRRWEGNIKMGLQEVGGVVGTGWGWLRIGTVAGTCGYGEGLSSSINAGNLLTSCKVYWLASQEGLCSME
jgi:hypothetical protein